MSIATVKNKLCSHSGTNPSAMILELKDNKGSLLAVLNDDGRKLGFYSPSDGYVSLSLHYYLLPPSPQVYSLPPIFISFVYQLYFAHYRYRPHLSLSKRVAGRHQQSGKVCDERRRL